MARRGRARGVWHGSGTVAALLALTFAPEADDALELVLLSHPLFLVSQGSH